MEVRPGANPADVKNYDTDRLRHDFLIQDLFAVDEIKTIYSQIDRIIVGAATPAKKTLVLEVPSFVQSISSKDVKWVLSISAVTVQLQLTVQNTSLSTRTVCISEWVQKKFHLQVMMLQILQSSISTVHRHTRLIRQYLSTLQRTFFLKIRRNLDVLKVQITEQSTSTFFRDRLKAVSLKWV